MKYIVPALSYDVQEYGVGFFLRDGVSFLPNIGEMVKATVGGQHFDLVFVGGMFTFKKLNISLVTFVRAGDDKDRSAR